MMPYMILSITSRTSLTACITLSPENSTSLGETTSRRDLNRNMPTDVTVNNNLPSPV